MICGRWESLPLSAWVYSCCCRRFWFSSMFQCVIPYYGWMLFIKDLVWYKSLNIHYTVGVDGISVAMIGLTSNCCICRYFASWEMDYLTKEFFVSLILLATGFLDSSSQSTCSQCSLLWACSYPDVSSDRDLGKRSKGIFCHEAHPDAYGSSALILVGILGIHFNSALTAVSYLLIFLKSPE